ncbi:transcriptional regulator NrdR [Candidatus Roizmanbacteria bacterium RIFCSPHIGHO2_12_FULL_41_11]|uniref:Transcriptional repressor NrdR n=3 Tax=Candidatus Roizmaniibacteriota TaxID=1752723 RepID=A0A1F7JQM2_9BACT|nr:MAG: transcriptional regulator NrdR [Candidatus Roizmanbacteria bacterium RIFCSPHIGHO2_12_FULL_41_11]OGK51975.1 MAG: transcriptional regulator NrdR [Candidatus Roizmanbacteria bacterium RIFCSPLOWO2_01_FULL_41_22]OGK57902.1 MAG: transcriptional regulator NrdR [Candidatus Roizmanbacteria bacterium RIFCSPLOWO2_02_FULL_41_9]
MFCLFCKHENTEVIETRVTEDGTAVRRRRSCIKCGKRFTTYERVEELPLLVIKRDGRRERFDRQKLRRGIIKAVGKTTVTAGQVENILGTVENKLPEQGRTEIASQDLGEMVAQELKKYDKVAYIRFASVFKRFVDVEEFEKELKKIS